MNEKHEPNGGRTELSDYLWDCSGGPDPEIQRLERALETFRPAHLIPPSFPRIERASGLSSWWSTITSLVWVPRFAAAALLAAVLVSGILLTRSEFPSSPAAKAWEVELTTIKPAGAAVKDTARKSRLLVGETLETDGSSTASISVAEVGRLDLEPSTRLRLLQSGEGRQRLALDRGTIHAAIWAPPGEFVVDTPSAVAIDLGCMYTLQVDESGGGILRTTLGWVGFRSGDRESFIPAGAAAVARPQLGPGTPYFEDASEDLRSALSQFDLSNDPSARHIALQTILYEARVHDGLTLWHLLARADDAERPAVFDRLARLVPPPDGVTRDGVLHLNHGMLDSWWNALDLGDIGLWRHFEQSWIDR
jgi:hypothetical protein